MRSGSTHLCGEAAAQLVMAEQRGALVDEVPPWLEAAACNIQFKTSSRFRRLCCAVAKCGFMQQILGLLVGFNI